MLWLEVKMSYRPGEGGMGLDSPDTSMAGPAPTHASQVSQRMKGPSSIVNCTPFLNILTLQMPLSVHV
jgi:hypothetical protein